MEVKEPAVQYGNFPRLSPVEFIVWEGKQDLKYEYYLGKIVAMAGASVNHNKILASLIGKLQPALAGSGCDIYPSDLRVLVKSKESFFYPDATIICGEPDMSEEFTETVKNPSVVFEILSPSTEDYDIGKKFFFYMQIPSLQEYITIDSTSFNVRVGRRNQNNSWTFEEYSGVDNSFVISTVEKSITLSDLYSTIRFQ